MILVADCSALIALSVCDSFGLLEHLFDAVVVPGTDRIADFEYPKQALDSKNHLYRSSKLALPTWM
jgi:predicted nucleic acid-binding protein